MPWARSDEQEGEIWRIAKYLFGSVSRTGGVGDTENTRLMVLSFERARSHWLQEDIELAKHSLEQYEVGARDSLYLFA